jgi:hypothetical protein
VSRVSPEPRATTGSDTRRGTPARSLIGKEPSFEGVRESRAGGIIVIVPWRTPMNTDGIWSTP